MKNFKRFILLTIACLAVCVLFACDHEHTYASKWSFNDTMHWHAATCEDCDDASLLLKDAAGHVDGDHDGDCDVCGYADATHEHTYASAWSFDENNHWHVSTCYHDTTSENEAHDYDAYGVCKDCGYNVGGFVFGSVKDAIDVAVANKGSIVSGVLTVDYGVGETISNYIYTNDCTIIDGEYADYYYSLDADGNVIGVILAWGEVNKDIYANENSMNGVYLSDEFASLVFETYGAEDFLATLYEIGKADANLDYAETIDGNELSFSFGNYDQYNGLYVIEISFVMNESYYAINEIQIKVTNYDNDSIEVKSEATEEASATYKVKDGAEGSVSFTGSFVQDNTLTVDNPYSKDKLAITYFDIADEYENLIWNTEDQEIEVGADYYYNFMIENGAIAFNNVSFVGENVHHTIEYVASGLVVNYDEGSSSFKINAKTAGTYEVAITVGEWTATYTFVAKTPVPTKVEAGSIVEKYGNIYFNVATESATVTAGEPYTLAVCLDKGAGVTVTSEGLTIPDGVQINCTYDDGWYYPSVVVYTYDFPALEVGTYTFNIVADQDATLTTTFTINVVEGSGSGSGEGGESTETITPASGEGTATNPFVITESGNYVASVEGIEYKYYTYTATVDGDVTLTFSGDKDAQAGTSNFDFLTMIPGDSQTYTLTAGQVLCIKVGSMTGEGNQDVPFTVTLPGDTAPEQGGGETGEMTGTGTIDDPFILTEAGTYTCVATTDYTYYAFTANGVGTVTITSSSADYWIDFGTASPMRPDHTIKNEDATNNSVGVMGNTVYILVSTNEIENGTVEFTVTFTAA